MFSSRSSLTSADAIVLQDLLDDISRGAGPVSGPLKDQDKNASLQLLADSNNHLHPQFQPTVFTSWDLNDLHRRGFINRYLLKRYTSWAESVVRRPTDVVFLTHTIFYLLILAPSGFYLFYQFSWAHALLHWLIEVYSCGPFTLMLHNHIHNDGLLKCKYAWLDRSIPYVLEPLMGHTWDSYYYHHVKHHHVENNGPDDISSTIRYQRDSLSDFLIYVGRFLCLTWIKLPQYFLTKGRYGLAIKSFASEVFSMILFIRLACSNFNAALIVVLLPLVQTRIGMMVGNWGQHAFIDKSQPASNYRSSITLIDVQSNRYCFNDGYHTSHHLNPRRHWREHPLVFLRTKDQYHSEGALVFQGIDFLFITFHLLRKNYDHLASCLVPMGNQTGLNPSELASMLRRKTEKFTEENIRLKF